MKIKVSNVNTPNWKEVTVKSRIPVELERLSEIARNIWWAWNFEATELFRDLDPELWTESRTIVGAHELRKVGGFGKRQGDSEKNE